MKKNNYLKIGILSLLFVFAFAFHSFAQVSLSLRYSSTDSKYHVYLTATQALSAVPNPKLTDGSSIITVTAPTSVSSTNPLTIGTVTSVSPIGIWSLDITHRNNGDLVSALPGGGPAPQNTDFFVFIPSGDFTSINYTVGQEVELFNFDVTGYCAGNMGLLPSDGQTATWNGNQYNIGSYYSVKGYPGSIGTNHFSATYNMVSACPTPGAPDLVTSIGQPATPFVVGTPSNVPVTTTNQGTSPTTGAITTTITLPVGFSAPAGPFTTNGNSCTTSGQVVTCTNPGPLSNTAPSNTTTMQIPVTPAASTAGTTPQTTGTSSTPGETNTANNPATPMSPTTPVAGVPDLVTSVGQPATPFVAGTPSNVPVTTTNQGSGPANGPITTTVTLPTGFTAPAGPFTTNGNTCTTSGQVVTCTNPGPLSNLAPNNATTMQIPVTPSASTVGSTPPTTATSSAPNEPAGSTGNNPSTPMSPTTPVTGTPDLITTVGQPATPFVAGQPSNVPVTTTNQGSGPANGPITTTVTLPTGFTAPAGPFTSNGNTCTTSGQVVTCINPGPLSNTAPNNTTTMQIPVTPAASTVGTTPPTTATSSAPNEPAGSTGNNPATPMVPTTPVTGTPDLVTTVGQPATPFVAGQPSNVPVTTTNQGTSPTTGVVTTTITLPTGFSAPAGPFTSNGNTCTTSGQVVTCTNPGPLSNLAPNNATTMQIPVTPSASTVGTTPPTTGTSSTPGETNTGNNPSAPMIPTTPVQAAAAPDLVTTIGQPQTPFVAGQVSNIPLTLTNQGSAPATGTVTVSMTLPTGFTAPATFTSNGNTCVTAGQTVSCFVSSPLSNVAPNNAATVLVPVTPAASTIGTTPTFTGTGSATNEPAVNQGNNAATPMSPTTPVSGTPDLVTTIGQPATPFVAGQPSNVPVTTTNQGSGPANGPVTTTITLPTGFTAPAGPFTTNGNTCTTSGQVVTCTNPGPLSNTAPSNTTTMQIPVTPSASTVGTTPPTTATSSAPNEPAGSTGNNPSTPMSPTTPVAGVPDLVTSVGQPATPFIAGQPSNVPVTTTNQGTSPTTGVVTTTITLPTGFSAPAGPFTTNGNTCTTSGQVVTCTNPGPLSNLAPNNATTMQIPVTPSASTVGTTPPTTGTSSTPGETNTGNNPATPMTPTTPVQAAAAPDLVTTIGQPQTPFVAGQVSNVPLTLTNQGTAPATGTITVSMTLPTGFSAPTTFTSNGNTCITSGQTVSCFVPSPLSHVAPNNTTTLLVPVTPAASTVGTTPVFSGTGSTSNEPAANTSNNPSTPMSPTTPVAGTPDLVTTVGQPATPFVAGQPSNVPVTTTNQGSGPANGPITTTITLPTGFSAPSTFTSNGNTCTTSGQVVTCTNPGPLSNLAPNNSTTIQVPVTPGASTVGTTPPTTGTSTAPNEPGTSTGNNPSAPMVPTTPVAPAPLSSVKVNVKVLLQGAYDVTTGLMRDDLRAKGYLPTSQPYSAMPRTAYHTGTETTTLAALSTAGANAIVDWVLVELRTGTGVATRVATRAALVQRDGDVVDTDGVSSLSFANRAAGSYYVVVTHRNHLGVMSDVAMPLSTTASTCDFTLAYDGFGNKAQKEIGAINVLWAGNVNHTDLTHRNTIFSGINNDPDGVKNDIISHTANLTAQNYSYVPGGYYLGDTNLDGDVKYQGLLNDVDNLIFFNVLTHPLNTTVNPLYLITEQH